MATGFPVHLGVTLQRGSESLRDPCSHLPAVCAQPVFSGEGQIILSDKGQTNTPTFQRTRVNTVTLPPCNSPHRTMDEVHVNMAASSIDIFQSCRAVPQCNLHPTHFPPFFANNYLLYRGCVFPRVCPCARVYVCAAQKELNSPKQREMTLGIMLKAA